jgi:hypothetical protein
MRTPTPDITAIQRVRGNPDLVDIVQNMLIPEFHRHGKHPSRTERAGESRPAYFDPWWWPVDPANEPADWGLNETQSEEFLSLCDVKVNGNKWTGFTGSLGAKEGCIWIIGERPSFDNRYGNVIRYLRQKLELLSGLPALAESVDSHPPSTSRT